MALASPAADVGEEHLRGREAVLRDQIGGGRSLHEAFIDDSQRSGSGNRVSAEKSSRDRPVGHVGRK